MQANNWANQRLERSGRGLIAKKKAPCWSRAPKLSWIEFSIEKCCYSNNQVLAVELLRTLLWAMHRRIDGLRLRRRLRALHSDVD